MIGKLIAQLAVVSGTAVAQYLTSTTVLVPDNPRTNDFGINDLGFLHPVSRLG